MWHKTIIFLAISISYLVTLSQNVTNVDSLVKIGENLAAKNPDSAKKIFETALEKLKLENKYYTDKSKNIVNNLIQLYFSITDLESVDSLLQIYYDISTTTKDTSSIVFYYYKKAHYYVELGLYEKAIESLTEALDFIVKNNVNNDELLLVLYNGIGNVYSSLKDYKQAKIYRKKALAISKKLKYESLFGDYINLGTNYLSLKDYDSAEYCFKKSYEISKNDTSNLYLSLVNLGTVYTFKKKYKIAIDYFLKSLDICKKNGYYSVYPYIYTSLSEIYLTLYDTLKNKSFLDKAIKYARLSKKYSKTLFDKVKTNKRLYEIFEAYNNCDSSYYYYKLYTHLSDSLQEISSNKETKRKLFQMSLKIKDNEIKLKNQKLNEIKKRKELQSRIYTIIIISLIIFVILILLNYLQKRKANKKLEEKNIVIEEKNLQIVQSFKYAKTLLNTINNSDKLLEKYFPSSFIIDLPKEIIGGDFFWLKKINNNEFLFALSDCTGHGIPGAFLNITGQLTLTNLVVEHNITDPDELLNNLHKSISEILTQKNDLISDGMDIIILKINTQKNIITWSSANRTSLIFTDENTNPVIIEPDIYSIGDSLIQNNPKITFTKHEINYNKKIYIYLFSDGITDLFGGSDNKKFGMKRLINLLSEIKNKPAAEQKEIILSTIKKWKGNRTQTDDITIVGIKIEPQ